MLGLLALLLGFSFSMALPRFDSRSDAVNEEANAIGAAYLRIELLAAADRDRLRAQMQEYVRLRVATADLLLESLNDAIDAYGMRQASLRKHIPEVARFVLFAVFLATACIFGISAGLADIRPTLVTYAMHALIVFVIYIVIDLDRPGRGVIQVNHASLTALATSIGALPESSVSR